MPLTSGTKLGPYEILRPMGAGGMGEESEELLLPSENSDTQIWPTSWSGDDRFILYSRGSIGGQGDIWILPLAGDRKPRLFVQTPGAAYDGQFSPNARWVAYTSKESGREEVYVVPFEAAKVLNTSPGVGKRQRGRQMADLGQRWPFPQVARGRQGDVLSLGGQPADGGGRRRAGQWHRSGDGVGPLQGSDRSASVFPLRCHPGRKEFRV